MRATVFPDIQGDFILGETFKPANDYKLPCPLFVCVGHDDERHTEEQMDGWRFWVDDTPHICEIELFPGGHHYLFTEGESDVALVEHLKERLEHILAKGSWDEFLKGKQELNAAKNALLEDKNGDGDGAGGEIGLEKIPSAAGEAVSKLENTISVRKSGYVSKSPSGDFYGLTLASSGGVSKIALASSSRNPSSQALVEPTKNQEQLGLMHLASVVIIFLMFLYMV